MTDKVNTVDKPYSKNFLYSDSWSELVAKVALGVAVIALAMKYYDLASEHAQSKKEASSVSVQAEQ